MAGDNLNLLIPQALKAEIPLDSKTLANISRSRQAIANIISSKGTDDRLLVVVGPCSIHDTDAAHDYAQRLAALSARLRHDLMVVMRVYIEKPRTTVGWKGLVHDPHMSQLGPEAAPSQSTIARGLRASRSVMARVAPLGLPVATELLSPLVAPFVDDCLALGVVGARTTESQTHRELASECAFPVGFKNGTDGSLGVALDAMRAAAATHTVLGVDGRGALVERRTAGNADTFVVLRGGKGGPNFAAEHVRHAEEAMVGVGRAPGVVVDCSHGNSNKDYRNQAKVAACVGEQIADGSNIKGVMIESNIHAVSKADFPFSLALGRQDIPACGKSGLQYGVSVTDGCMGWNETETTLEKLAAAVRTRRNASHQALRVIEAKKQATQVQVIDVPEPETIVMEASRTAVAQGA